MDLMDGYVCIAEFCDQDLLPGCQPPCSDCPYCVSYEECSKE